MNKQNVQSCESMEDDLHDSNENDIHYSDIDDDQAPGGMDYTSSSGGADD